MEPHYERLTTEQRNPRTLHIDQATAAEIVDLMNAEDVVVVGAVAEAQDTIAAAIDLVADRLGRGGRLIYVGAGTSGRLAALDAAECPPTFGTEPEQVQVVMAGGSSAVATATEGAEDDRPAGTAALAALRAGPDDVVMGISASGVTPFVMAAIETAHQAGAATIVLICNPLVEVPAWVQQVIRVVVGPEVIAGSTRLKAGTATKMVLNMISTGAMIRLGKVYQNLMVDVRPTNAKLRDRARRIVSMVTGLGPEPARELLEQTDWDLKAALVMGLTGVDLETARTRLTQAGGRVHQAIGAAT